VDFRRSDVRTEIANQLHPRNNLNPQSAGGNEAVVEDWIDGAGEITCAGHRSTIAMQNSKPWPSLSALPGHN
jgi:hypothetical protein